MIKALKNFQTFTLASEFYDECKKVKLDSNLRDQLRRATQGILLTLADFECTSTRSRQCKSTVTKHDAE